MQSLAETIRALRAEVAAALADARELPAGCRLETGRVVATIGFSVVTAPGEDGGKDTTGFVVSPGSPGGHSLQIEFIPGDRVAAGRPSAPSVAPAPRAAKDLRGVEAERVVAALSGVFGVPGFDSSARATVFREALEPLGPKALANLFAVLDATAPTGDREVDRARHLVRRIIVAGAGGLDEGIGALREVFGNHDAAALVRLVEDRWRTQDDWL